MADDSTSFSWVGAPGSVMNQGGALAPPAPIGMSLYNGANANVYDPRGLVPYIRSTAIKYGIDPDIAVKVAASEGLGNPVGDGGKSGGAFQLYTGGGMGNDFIKAGLGNPLDPTNEKATIDYALSQVPKTGWTPFHGAARVGVGAREGIPGSTNTVSGTDPSIDTSGYPGLGTSRQMASLTPVPPDTATNPLVAQALAASNPDPTGSTIDNLLSNSMGYNPSKLLASAAAGFLGGNGTAQSLSKGFAGIAASQKDDQTEQGALMRMQAMFGSNVMRNAGMFNRAGVPLGDAMVAAGANLTPEQRASYNASSRAAMPIPAGTQKIIQANSQGILAQRNDQIQLKTIRDQIANGDFSLDAAHRALYATLNAIGMPSDASQKYMAMTQTLQNMRQDLLKSVPGAASDKRAEMALDALTGGGGFTSSEQAINHFDYLGNRAALNEGALRKQIENGFTLSKQQLPAGGVEGLLPPMPKSPYEGVDPDVLGKRLYGDNTTNPNATAAPGAPLSGNAPAAAPAATPVAPLTKPGQTMTLPSGKKVTLIGAPQVQQQQEQQQQSGPDMSATYARLKAQDIAEGHGDKLPRLNAWLNNIYATTPTN